MYKGVIDRIVRDRQSMEARTIKRLDTIKSLLLFITFCLSVSCCCKIVLYNLNTHKKAVDLDQHLALPPVTIIFFSLQKSNVLTPL